MLSGPAQRGFPGWMVGPLAHRLPALPDSPPMLAADLTRALAILGIAWLVAVLCAPRVPSPIVWTAVVATHVTLLMGPPLALTDVFNYLHYGRMPATYGVNPYASLPLTVRQDPAYHFSNWHHLPSPYGPLFTLLTEGLAPLSLPTAYWAWKGVLLAAALGTLVLVAVHRAPARALAAGRGRARRAQPARARLRHRRGPQRAAGAAVQRGGGRAGGRRLAGGDRAVVGRRGRRLRRAGRGLQAVGRPPRAPRGLGLPPAPACPGWRRRRRRAVPARRRGALRRAPAGDQHPGRARRAAERAQRARRARRPRWADAPRSRHHPRRARTGRRGRDRGRDLAARMAAGGRRLRHARHRPDARLDDALVRVVGPALRRSRAHARARGRVRAAHRVAGARGDPADAEGHPLLRLLPDAHARRGSRTTSTPSAICNEPAGRDPPPRARRDPPARALRARRCRQHGAHARHVLRPAGPARPGSTGRRRRLGRRRHQRLPPQPRLDLPRRRARRRPRGALHRRPAHGLGTQRGPGGDRGRT